MSNKYYEDISIPERIKREIKKIKSMPRDKMLTYLWDYYKVPALMIGLFGFIIISVIHTMVTSKDCLYYNGLVNTVYDMEESDTVYELKDGLEAYLELDTKEQEVTLDIDLNYSTNPTDQYAMSGITKIATLAAAQALDSLTCSSELFETFAQLDYFWPLTSIYTEEELKAYEGQIYYMDKADIRVLEDENTAPVDPTLIVDHTDPSTMDEPVPMGIILSEDNLIVQAGYFDYLEFAEPFQGYPQKVVIGITGGSQHIDNAKDAIAYYENK